MAMNRAEFDADFAEAAKQAQRMLDVRKPATALSRFYFDPRPEDRRILRASTTGAPSRAATTTRRWPMLTTGKTGEMIAVLPETAKFKHRPARRRPLRLVVQAGLQGRRLADHPHHRAVLPAGAGRCDAQGYPYMGAIWYRMRSMCRHRPRARRSTSTAPAIETEAWVWVNGNSSATANTTSLRAPERPRHGRDQRAGARQEEQLAIRVHTGTAPPPSPTACAPACSSTARRRKRSPNSHNSASG